MTRTPPGPPRSALIRTRASAIILALAVAFVAIGASPASADVVGSGPGSFSGSVTAAGAPVEGVYVSVSGAQGGYFQARTDATGAFSFVGLDAGEYWVYFFTPSEYQRVNSPMLTIGEGSLDVVRDVALELWPVGTASISGTVVDSATNAPLLNVGVSLFDFETGYNAHRLTDELGAFTLSSLTGGTYNLSISAFGYVYTYQTVSLLADQNVVINTSLVPANSAISGHVEDEAGNPVAGLWVQTQPDSGLYGFGTFTDELGNYAAQNLGAGGYTITVGGPGTSWATQSAHATALANETTTVDFVLTPRITGSVLGYVSTADGTPIEGICVEAHTLAGEVVAAGRTDTGGVFEISEVDTGNYKLLYWDCIYTRVPAFASTFTGGSAVLSGAVSVTVAAGEETWTDQVLAVGASIDGHIAVKTVDGQVELPTNRGMDASVFQLVDGNLEKLPDPSPFVGGGGQGDYTVSGLPAGEYYVGFVDSTFFGARSYATQYWQDAATIQDAVAITVAAGDTVTGIDALVSIPEPTAAPVGVATASLPAGGESDIDAPDSAAQGGSITVVVGAEYAGEWVSVWGHSTPTLLGDWVQVTSAGTVSVTVPTALIAGQHTLVAQTADDEVIGWTGVSVTAPAVDPEKDKKDKKEKKEKDKK